MTKLFSNVCYYQHYNRFFYLVQINVNFIKLAVGESFKINVMALKGH